ncbi:hypothetical protein [Rickettsia endosymbiont of Orchestes rusci]
MFILGVFSGFPLLARMTYCCFYRAMQQSQAIPQKSFIPKNKY